MSTSSSSAVNVYVDGFNVFHGCLSNPNRTLEWSQCKWLNYAQMMHLMFPNHDIQRIRYFTALVHGEAKRKRQRSYWDALNTLPNLEIHEGRFYSHAKKRLLAVPGAKPPAPDLAQPPVEVFQQEEKGSDVNLATYLMLDACKNEFDLAIVVSNDSDLAEPIKLVRSELGKRVFIVNPQLQPAHHLKGIADGYRYIRLGHLQGAQFPDPILAGGKKVIPKPKSW